MAKANDLTPLMMLSGMYSPNPYSQFQGRLPMMGYQGTPTDALGNPIQSPPGTTLNTTPAAAPATSASQPTPQQWAYNNDMLNAMGRNLQGGGGLKMGDIVNMRAQNNAMYGMTQPPGGPVLQSSGPNAATPPGTQAGASPGAGAGSMDQALALLANPGKVMTPGATAPQATLAQGPSVLDSFLASRQGGTGAGNYSNQGFFDTLNRLRNQ
jgi:hypothetical protein